MDKLKLLLRGYNPLEIYELMYSAIQSTNLLYSGHQLIEFANAAYKEKNRATLIKHFYENLYRWCLNDYIFGDRLEWKKSNYYICDEAMSTSMYIALRIPTEKSAVK
jgi:hypothetical protein